MLYNNSFEFVMKVLGKELPIKILQTSKLIECQYNCIEYSQKTKFIDINLKLAMKHFFIQAQVDYLDSICNKKNLTVHDLGFFSNMMVMKGLTSAPSIDLLNVDTKEYEKINSVFFSDKKVLGHLGNQYLSPITTFLFHSEWDKLSAIHKYQKILDYDKNFSLNLLNDVNCIAEAIWKDKVFSGEYNNFDNFLLYYKELTQQQYWIHNYGDYKIYKSINNFSLYPEIYQILYNLSFDFNVETSQSKILFDSIFFDKNFIEENDLTGYKNIDEFKNQLINWRDKGKIIEFKKNLLFIVLLKEKYLLEDFLKNDLEESLNSLLIESKKNDVFFFLLFLDKNISTQKIKIFLQDDIVSFYYYVPFFETTNLKNNLLLLGIKNDKKNNFGSFLNSYNFCDNPNEIINYLLINVDWEKTDLFNHYLYWNEDSLIIVSSYLDFVSGGLVSLIPKTWNN